jgi:hypothetical protein
MMACTAASVKPHAKMTSEELGFMDKQTPNSGTVLISDDMQLEDKSGTASEEETEQDEAFKQKN